MLVGCDAELREWVLRDTNLGPVIEGFVYNDSRDRFGDGRLVTTSLVQELHTPEGNTDAWYCKTLNTIYHLEGKSLV